MQQNIHCKGGSRCTSMSYTGRVSWHSVPFAAVCCNEYVPSLQPDFFIYCRNAQTYGASMVLTSVPQESSAGLGVCCAIAPCLPPVSRSRCSLFVRVASALPFRASSQASPCAGGSPRPCISCLQWTRYQGAEAKSAAPGHRREEAQLLQAGGTQEARGRRKLAEAAGAKGRKSRGH